MAKSSSIEVEFVIVGASVCGLSAAIALSRVGHKVTVFDVTNPFEPTPADGGCRLPPNSTKMYYRWGLEERLRKCGVHSNGTMFASFDSGAVVDSQEWEEDVMEETGGDFLLIHYSDLRRTLAEFAQELGATIRYGPDARVVGAQIDEERPSVTLETGEIVSADVIVGADGYSHPGWNTRKEVMEALEQEHEHEPTGIAVYSALIPEADLDAMEDKVFLEKIRGTGKVFTWFGNSEFGAQMWPVTPSNSSPMLALYVYAPHEFDEDAEEMQAAYSVTPEAMLEVIKDADPRLKALASHATTISCVPIYEQVGLEDWVHPDGRLVCLGEAAHPTPVGSTYTFGMCTGDAAVLGRLFTHIHRKEQISSFLSAVQEIRQSRVENVIKASTTNVFAVSLPPGLAETHDRQIRERAKNGASTLGRKRQQSSEEMMQVVVEIFGYDPEDEADDWWVEWGLMQERAAHWTIVDQPVALVIEEAQQEQTVVTIEVEA